MSFLSNINTSKLKAFATSIIASSKENAPTLMTGGSIILGWVAVYFFWKQGRKAEKRIEYEESKINTDLPPETPPSKKRKLEKSRKITIYLEYCWMAAVLGLASTGLAIGANELNLSRIAEMALCVKLMKDDNAKKDNIIDKMKAELGDKKSKEIEREVREEQYPTNKMLKIINNPPSEGLTWFIDTRYGNGFWSTVEEVKNKIYYFNEKLKKRRRTIVQSCWDYVNDDPRYNDEEGEAYSSIELEEFLKDLGEVPDNNPNKDGHLWEFRYYGGNKDPIPVNLVLDFQSYKDTNTNSPIICFIDYDDYLEPTYALLERIGMNY